MTGLPVTRAATVLCLPLLLIGSLSCSSSTDPEPGGDGTPAVEHTLTMGLVGQGVVTPAPGSHRHARDTIVPLDALPAVGWQFAGWIGPVADPGNQETTITMDGDHTVYAVFVSGDVSPPDEIDGALCNLEFEGEGFSAHYETWNCDGLEGEWRIRGEIDIDALDIFGTIEGENSFTMPPRPESGPWESAPFSWTMSGTIEADPAEIEISYHMQDVVVTIFEFPGGPTLMDARGTGLAMAVVTIPEGTYTLYEEFFEIAFVPTLIVFERHAACD